MKKIINLVLLFAILSTPLLNAQHFGRMFDSELKSKLQSYHKENVCPMWTQWRAKIESSLNEEDLNKLIQLRQEAQKIIAEKRECLENCREESGNKGEGYGKVNKGKKGKSGKSNCEEKCGLRESREYFATELKDILSRYDNTVKQILDDAKPYHETWQKDKKAIIDEHLKNNEQGSSRGKGMRKGHFHGGKEPTGKFFIGMLMMWNGSCDANPEDLFELGSTQSFKKDDVSVKTYPNPFTDKTTISFKLQENSIVKLFVTSSNGEIVKSLVDGNLNAGEHSYDFNAGSLTPGAYIYKLDVNGNIKSGKIILNK